jgi:hypothetical protein
MKKVPVARKRITVGFKGMVSKTDPKILDPAYSPCTANFIVENGVLKSNIGIEKAKGYYPDDPRLRIEFETLNSYDSFQSLSFFRTRAPNNIRNDVIFSNIESGSTRYTYLYKKAPWYTFGKDLNIYGDICWANYNFDGEDILLISGESFPLTKVFMGPISTNIDRTMVDTPCFVDIAVYNERVFGILADDRRQVWFSDDFNPTNWRVDSESAGYLQFVDDGGSVIKLIAFQNYLYIFRERSIHRLTAYADQSEFVLKKVLIDTGFIYKNTISVSGDKIVYMTSEGLYSFDGYNSTPIAKELPEIVYKETAYGTCRENSYYLACRALVAEEFAPEFCINNALLKYDFKSGLISMCAPLDIRKIYTYEQNSASDIFVIFNVENKDKLGMLSDRGVFFDSPTKKIFKSAENLIDNTHFKIVRDIAFTSKYPVTVIVCLDGKEYSYDIEGGEGVQKIDVNKSGQVFSVRLETQSQNSYITPLNINVDLL